MGSRLGTLKAAAKRLGLDCADYMAALAAGNRWCSACKEWHPIEAFARDGNRPSGVAAYCRASRHVDEPRTTKGRVSTFKGHRHTDSAKSAMSAAHLGHPNPMKGQVLSVERRQAISRATRAKALRGEACPAFKDGRVDERRDERRTLEYKRWRYDVFSRDGFACVDCGDARGGNLVAHHIKPFADFPNLRVDVANGVTLCAACHARLHSF